MVRDYVTDAVRAGRRVGPTPAPPTAAAGARELAGWKAQVAAAWPKVHVLAA